jgi:hypothetical protein
MCPRHWWDAGVRDIVVPIARADSACCLDREPPAEVASMTPMEPRSEPRATGSGLDSLAGRMGNWGFLAHPDLPDGPGPAFLLVALRPVPTFEHFDPEAVDYWVTVDGYGDRRTLRHDTRMPIAHDFSWGAIRLVDRLDVTNEYLTFGGHLDAIALEGIVIAAFTSPAPLLRRGGHSQAWDPGADVVGAFFGRMVAAVAVTPGFEAILGAADPMTRYAAFVRQRADHLWADRHTARALDDLEPLLRREADRLQTTYPTEWAAAAALLDAAEMDVRPVEASEAER